VEGLLYYPYIAVPQGDWLIRSLLYWDRVATIIPTERWEAHEIGNFNVELMNRDLLTCAFPSDANTHLRGALIENYIDALSAEEVAKRRDSFENGHSAQIHKEKMFFYGPRHDWFE
jgi:hypothetical protein